MNNAVVRVEEYSPALQQRRTIVTNYKIISDTTLPASYRYENRVKGELFDEESVSLSYTSINVDIPDSVFTMEGIKPNEDTIFVSSDGNDSKQMRWKDSKLILDSHTPSFMPQESRRGMTMSSILFVLNGALFGAIAIWYWFVKK